MKSSKKMIFIFPSSGLGGSELCTIETIIELKKKGFNCYCIIPNQGDILNHFEQNGILFSTIHYDWWVSPQRWSLILKLKMIFGFFKSALKVKAIIKEQKSNLTITVSSVTPVGALASMMAGIKHVWYIHEYVDLDHKLIFNYGKRFTYFLINRLSNKIVTVSNTLKKYLSQHIKNKEIIVIPNIAKYPCSYPIKKLNNPLQICLVGRISSSKNQLIAIKALQKLKEINVFPTLTIVGTGDSDYIKLLKDFIIENDLSNQVVFTGYSSNPVEHVKNSDCVLVCSYMEAFGRVTIEAMKAGKLVIASKTGAGQEIIKNGETGYLFNPNDSEELAQCIIKAYKIESKFTIEVNAYAYATSTYTKDSHINKFKSLFE